MAYDYTDGTGLGALDETRPSNTEDLVSDLPDSISQIKKFLKDPTAGLATILSYNPAGQSYLKLTPVDTLPSRFGIEDFSVAFVTTGANAGTLWIALPGEASWSPLLRAAYTGSDGTYLVSKGDSNAPEFESISNSIYEYNLAYATAAIGTDYTFVDPPVSGWHNAELNNLNENETTGLSFVGNDIVLPFGKYEVDGAVVARYPDNYRARIKIARYDWNAGTSSWDFDHEAVRLESISGYAGDGSITNVGLPIKGLLNIGEPLELEAEVQYRLVFQIYVAEVNGAGASNVNTGLPTSLERYSHLILKRYVLA